jgi:hypothetical protein
VLVGEKGYRKIRWYLVPPLVHGGELFASFAAASSFERSSPATAPQRVVAGAF